MSLTCNIVGNLLDSGISPIGATLEVTAESFIVDDSTNPDSVILPAPRTFTIPSTGVIDIDLPRTESARVAYIFKLNATGYFKEFRVVIPDQAEVEFASLLSTTFTTDRSVTGALVIAKEMVTNPRLLPYLVSGLGIVKQPTVPAGPVAGEQNVIWVDISTGLTWVWNDAASKWLSENQQLHLDVMDASALTNLKRQIPNPLAKGTIRLESVALRWNVQAGPNDSGNHWELQPKYRLASSVAAVNIGSAVVSNPSGYSVGTNRSQLVTIGANFSYTAMDAFLLSLTPVGSPGVINASATLNYRFFAT